MWIRQQHPFSFFLQGWHNSHKYGIVSEIKLMKLIHSSNTNIKKFANFEPILFELCETHSHKLLKQLFHAKSWCDLEQWFNLPTLTLPRFNEQKSKEKKLIITKKWKLCLWEWLSYFAAISTSKTADHYYHPYTNLYGKKATISTKEL